MALASLRRDRQPTKRIRVSGPAERDLDDIWFYVASQSGSADTADRLLGTTSTTPGPHATLSSRAFSTA